MAGSGHGGCAARRALPFAAPVLWVLAILTWVYVVPLHVNLVPLLAATPAVSCAGTGHRRGVVFGGACALFALYPLNPLAGHVSWLHSDSADIGTGSRFGTCAAILCVVVASYLAARRRSSLTRELSRAREVATAAQEVLLRPPPARLEGYAVAAGQLSATRGAEVGGDLYDAVATPFGVRVIMGDVRGHGLAALDTVSAVLGTFREAAHDEAELDGLLRRLERGLGRHLRVRGAGSYGAGADGTGADEAVSEDFVTVLLLEARENGTVAAHNCGHPWPYRLSADGGASVGGTASEAEPLPPLGLFPLPAALPAPLRLHLPPGDALFLHTDGAEDARDARGTYFDLAATLRAALASAPCPAAVIASVRTALRAHTGDHFTDDAALLLLRNENPPAHTPPPSPCTAPDRTATVS